MKIRQTNRFLGLLRRYFAAPAIIISFFGAAQAATVTWNVTDGNWDTTTANWATGLYANGDDAIFNQAAGGTVTQVGSIAPLSTTVSAVSGTYTFLGSGITSGALNKSGAGTLVLGNGNTYTGATTINGGTLKVANPVIALPVISGMTVHLDATTIAAANGSNVTSWANLAAGGAGNFNVGAGTAPTFVSSGNTMNGRPVVHFNNSAMLSNATNFGNNVTVMYVGRMTGGQNRRLVGGGNNWLLGYWGGNMNTVYWDSGGGDLAGALDYGSHIFVASANGATGTAYDADGNETQTDTRALGAGPNGLYLGGFGPGEQSYGDVGELLVFNRALTAAERLQVEKYLQAKWYGALPSKSAVNITASGSSFDLNGFMQTIGSLAGVADSQVLINGGDLTIGNANTTTTFSGVIADGATAGGAITKTGNGDLVLGGSVSNTFTGTTTLMSGRIGLAKTGGAYPFTGPLVLLNAASPDLYATVDNQFQPGTVMTFTGAIGDHVRFELLGTTQTLAGIDNTGSGGRGVIQHREQVPTAAVDNNSELILNGTGNYSFDGYFYANGGSTTMALTKNGSGTQILGGNITYNGTTTLNAGVLTYTLANKSLTGPMILNGGTLNHTGGGFLTVGNSAGNALNVAVNSTVNVTNGSGNNNLFFDGGVTGAGNLTINNTGSATTGVHFRNLAGSYSGSLTVNGGQIAISSGAALVFANSPVTLNGTSVTLAATWAHGASDASLKSLTGNAASSVVLGAQTLTLGTNNGSGSFDGSISGTGNLIKTGTGSQVVKSALYTGATTVNGGALTLTLPPTNSSTGFTVADAATLNLTGVPGSSINTTNLALGTAGTATLGIGNFGGQTLAANAPVKVSSTFTAPATVTLNVGGNFSSVSTGTPYPLISYTGTSPAPSAFSALGLPLGVSGTLNVDDPNKVVTLTVTALDKMVWAGPAGPTGGVWDIGTTANWVYNAVVSPTNLYQDGALVLFDDTATTKAVTLNGITVLPADLVFDNSTDNDYSISGTGSIGGITALTKRGTGTLTLSNVNTYSGATTVDGGTLAIGSGGSLTGGGTVSVKNTAVLTENATGVISGASSLIFSSSGTSILSGANTYTGTTTVDAGTLVIGAGGSLTGGGTLSVNGTAVLNENATGVISGASSLIFSSTGTSLLSGANTYTGTTTVNAGIVQAGNATAFGPAATASLVFGAGSTGTAQLNGNDITLAALNTNATPGTPVVENGVANTSTLTVNNLAASTYAGVLKNGTAGTLALTKTGTGNLTLGGPNSNTHTGATTLTSTGQLILSKTGGAVAVGGDMIMSATGIRAILSASQDNQFAAGSVMRFTGSGDTRFELKGTAQTLGGLDSSGLVTGGQALVQHSEFGAPAVVDATSQLTLNVAGTNSYAFNQVLRDYSGGVLSLNKIGSGTQTLSGANITYSGATLVTSGLLKLTDTTAFVSAITNSATVEFNAVGTPQIKGTITGAGTYNKTGPGVVHVNGTNQIISASGQFNILEGTLQNNNNSVNWSSCTADMNISAGATLDLYADDIYVDSLTGAGTVNNGYGQAQTITVGVANGSGAFTGTLKNTSSPMSFVKSGSGSQVLAGVNSYTGTTAVNGGSLTVPASQASPTFTVANTATLNIAGAPGSSFSTNSLTLGAGAGSSTLGIANFGSQSASTSAPVKVNSTLTATGSITINVSGSFASVGTYPVIYAPGTITAGSVAALTINAPGLPLGVSGQWVDNTGTASKSVDLQILTLNQAVWAGNIDGVWDIGGTANWVPNAEVAPTGLYQDGTMVVFNDSGATKAITLNGITVLPADVRVDNSVGNDYSISGTGSIGGTGSLTKLGTGTLTLSNVNTYTGGTTINGGTLEIGGAGQLGAGSYAGLITNSGTLNFNSSANQTLGGTVTNSGTLNFVGTGNSTLNGPLTNSGTMNVTGSGVTSLTNSITNNGTLNFNSATNQLVSGTISGTGSLTKANANTLTLSGINSYSGGTTITGGTLKMDLSTRGTNPVALGALAVGPSATLELYNVLTTVDGGGTAMGATTFTGSGTINKTGAGYLDFWNGTATTSIKDFAGQINIQGGTLGSNASDWSSSVGAMSVDISSGANLDVRANGNMVINGLSGTGTVGSTYNQSMTLTVGGMGGSASFGGVIQNSLALPGATAGGVINLRKVGAGTQTLAGANTYTGTTTVNGGTLNLDYSSQDNSKLADVAALTLGGGAISLTGGTHTEVVASTTLNSGASAVSRPSGAAVLQMGVITRNTGATINFSADSIATTSSGTAGAMLGTWATVGSGSSTKFATKDANNFIIGMTGTLALTVNDFDSAAVDYDYALSGTTDTQMADCMANTVRYSGSGETIDLASYNLTINTLMNAGTGTLNLVRSGGSGSLVSNAMILNAVSGDINVSAPISGSNLTVTGPAIVTLSGTNTSTGTTTIGGGTLRAGSATALGNTVATLTGGTLDANGQSMVISSIVGDAASIITNTGANNTLTVGDATTTSNFAGVIQDGAGTLALTKVGSGTQILSGNNIYTGTTTINAGTLQIGSGGSTGAVGSANVANNGTIAFNRSGSYSVSNNITGAGTVAAINGSVTLSGSVTCNTLRFAGGNVTLSGSTPNVIQSVYTSNDAYGTLILAKDDGVTAFSGPTLEIANSDTGYNSHLVVQLGNNNQIADTTVVNICGLDYVYSGYAYFILNGFNETIAGLNVGTTRAYVQNNGAASSVLTLAGSGTYSLRGATVNDGSTGTLSIVKSGSGTQTFNGCSLTNTGALTLSGGTLNFQASTVNAPLAGSAGTLQITGGSNTNFGGSNKTYAADTVITGAGTILTQTASNSLSANSNHSVGTGASLNPGNFAGSIKGLAGAGSVVLGTTAAANLTIAGNTNLVFSGTMSGPGKLTLAPSASFAYAPSAAAALTVGALQFDGGNRIGTAVGGANSAAVIISTAAATATGANTVDITGVGSVVPSDGPHNLITAPSGLTAGGANYVLGNVYNASNFTVGALTVSDTVISIDVTGSPGIQFDEYWVGGYSGADNVWAVSNGSTESNWALDPDGLTPTSLVPGLNTVVHFSATNATVPASMTLGADMSIWGVAVDDASNVNLTADGKSLTLAGNDAFTGITVANAGGTLSIACPVVLGSIQTWTNDSVNDLTVSGPVSSALANLDLTKAGSGVLALNGSNSYSGATLLTAGTLKLGNVNALAGSTLDVTSSGTQVIFAVAGNNTYNLGGLKGSLDLALAGNSLSVGSNNSTTDYTGVLSGSGGLTKVGTGALTLSGTNAYTGTTTVAGGILNLSAAAPSQTGNLLMNTGGTFVRTQLPDQFSAGTVVDLTTAWGNWNRLEFLGNSQTLAGINTGSLAGQGGGVIQNGGVGNAGSANATLTLNGSSSYLFAGHLRDYDNVGYRTLGLDKSGSGTQILSGDKITYTGATTVTAGLLKLTDTNAFNSPINNSATVEFNATGAVNLGGSAALTGAGTYNKTGVGVMQVNGGQAISATGQINLQAGTLQNNGNSMNWTANTADMNMSAGTTLDLFADAIYVDALNGAGIIQNNYGNLAGAQSGAAAFYEKLVLGTNNGTGSFSGVIRNNSAGTTPANGTAGGGVDLVKVGTGTQDLSGANTYSGVTTVNGGTLSVSGAAGTINASSALTLSGGTLKLDNIAAANNGNRLKDAATVTMSGGGLNFANNGGAANYSETTGALTLAAGANTITTSQADASQSSTLTFASMMRTAGASVDFVGTGLGNVDARNKILITDNPPTPGGIIGLWATYNGSSLASYDPTLGVTAYPTSVAEDLTRLSSGTKIIADAAANNVRIIEGTGTAADITLAASVTTINTLFQTTADGTSPATIDLGGQTLRAASGILSQTGAGLLTLGTGTPTNAGTLTAGGAPDTAGTLDIVGNGAITINSAITDNGSGVVAMSKGGDATVTLAGINPYTGSTTVGAGTLALTGSLTGGGAITVSGAAVLTESGAGTISGASTLTHSSTATSTLGGTAANTYSGLTTLDNGIMVLNKTPGAFAISGPLNMGAGNTKQPRLQMLADNQFGGGALVTFANAAGNYTYFEIQGTTQTVAGIQGTTASGIIQNEKSGGGGTSTPGTLIIDSAGDHSYNGYIRNGGAGFDTYPLNIVKNGTGTQTLAANSGVTNTIMTYTGNVTVNGGKLIAAAVNGGGSPVTSTVLGKPDVTRTVTVNAGGTLEFVAPNVLGGHHVTLAPTIVVNNGGTLTNADPASTTVVNNGLNNLELHDGTLTSTTSNITPNDVDGTVRPNDYYGAWGINGTLTSTGTSKITTTDASVGAGRVLLRSTDTAGQDTVFDVTGTLTVEVILQGGDKDAGGLNKINTGKLVISSASTSTYRGPTTIGGGTLELNGSLVKSGPTKAPSAITVASGATLSGTGTAQGTVDANGAVAPGANDAVNPIGTLSAATTSFSSTGSLVAQINSTTAASTPESAADQLVINGDLNIDAASTLTLDDLDATVLSTAAKLVLVKYTGGWTGSVAFNGMPDDSTVVVEGNSYTLNYNDTDGSTSAVTLTAIPVVTDPFVGWAAGYGLNPLTTGAKDADPDGDDSNNLLEFATAGDPTSGSSGPRCYPLIYTLTGGDNALTYTIAVRNDVTAGFVPVVPDNKQQTATKDLVVYTVEGTDDLTTWNLVPVSEVTGGDATAVQTALGTKLTTPALDTVNYEWHTFRTDGGTALDPSDFIRLKVAEAPAAP